MKRGGSLRRKTRLSPVNRERRKRLYDRNFGKRADEIRAMRCLFCGDPPPSAPCHLKSRGAGGDKRVTVPGCDDCHRDLDEARMDQSEIDRAWRWAQRWHREYEMRKNDARR
jgi:hypothetical protein